MFRLLALTLVFTMVLGLVSCGNQPQQQSQTDTGTETSGQAEGVNLNYGISNSWDSLMPYYSVSGSNYSRIIYDKLYDRLAYIQPDGTCSPRAATSWESADGGYAILFHLDEGATFHDGTPVTAQHWVDTIALVTNPACNVLGRDTFAGLTGTDEIGRFDIMVDTDLNAIDTFTWQMVPIDDAHCLRDEEVENFIQRYRSATSQKYDRIITRLSCELTHPKRNQETALGDLIADILRDSFGIDLMLMGSGAIRSYALGPVVHYADLVECLPYDDAVYMLKVTGTQLERMIRHILRDEAFQGEHTEFYQFSHGTHIVWSRSEQAFRTLTLDGEALYAERLYTVAVQKYHYNNLKPFLDITLEEVEKNGKIRVLSTSARDVVEEYLTVNQHLSREVEGRLVVED